MQETPKVDDQSSADFPRRGTILRGRRGEKTGSGSDGATVSDKESGMSSGNHDGEGHSVYVAPWAIFS